jgi:alginate O-acetyltransferase complex protein AlgI
VYFDFSGYSDMAIGMGRFFGFHLLENFRNPLAAPNLRELWARWHISLSSWIREYLYIPLGGSRRSELRTHVNLWICFLTFGFWHGANWTFLLWGAAHGAGLTVQRHYERHGARALPRFFGTALTFTYFTLAVVLFRSTSLTNAVHYYGALFSRPGPLFFQVFVDNNVLITFGVALVLALGPAFPSFEALRARLTRDDRELVFLRACAAPLLVLAAGRALATDAAPFLYFRF